MADARREPEAGEPKHPLHARWPSFLDRLDDDPNGAWIEFHAFATRALSVVWGGAFAGVDPATREDAISAALLKIVEDDFRVLRSYRGDGGSFAAWLATIARSKLNDEYRKRLREVEWDPRDWVESRDPRALDPEREALDRAFVDAVAEALTKMSARCRQYLEHAADELNPRHMTREMGLDPSENKRVGDALRDCRKRLIELLRRAGWTEASEGRTS